MTVKVQAFTKRTVKKQLSGILLAALFPLMSASSAIAKNGYYASATDLQLISQAFDSASVGRDLVLNTVQVSGRLAAGRNITCNNCNLGGNVSAGHSISLNECEQVQSVSAGHDAEITDSHVLQHIAAGHDVILHKSKVAQRVSAGNELAIEGSEVQGLIALGGHFAVLDGSTATDILFSKQNQSVGSGIVIGGNNMATVRIGPSGLSAINGFTIKGAMSQTTVITPEQSIYVNGQKVSGQGPNAYSDYQSQNPEAPTVYGPGWDSGAVASSPKSRGKKKTASPQQPVVNVLELKNGSTVTGQVQFDSGYGKVVVYPGSQFSGKVINGFLEKKTR